MTNRIEVIKVPVLLVATALLMIGYFALLGTLPVADLAKEFGVPTVIGSSVAWYLEIGAAASIIIGLLTGLLSGGLGLIAAAGKTALRAYLRQELTKRGKKAFIAW